jgi:hypothetical protein
MSTLRVIAWFAWLELVRVVRYAIKHPLTEVSS